MKPYRSHDQYLNQVLKNPREAALYLNAAAKENDLELILRALSQVARAHGISKMSRKASLSRVGLYKMISRKGNPELRTFLKILNAFGLHISFKSAA